MTAVASGAVPAASSQVQAIWIWNPIGDKRVPFVHPSQIPKDESTASIYFVEGQRGPKITRISRATLLEMRGKNALVAQKGVTKEVPKQMILPWYEGLLLLQEVDEAPQDRKKPVCSLKDWADPELQSVLDQEKAKLHKGLVSGAVYAEKRLATVAVTGEMFFDEAGRCSQFRRENIKDDDSVQFSSEGIFPDGIFSVDDITGYMPPWQAFCHPSCGFYQDFYRVKWGKPYSEKPVPNTENGDADASVTWEPDECLPSSLDPLRVRAKRQWIKTQREAENQRPAASAATKRPAEDQPPQPPVKKSTKKRDSSLLDHDLLRHEVGHDLVAMKPAEFKGICSGWPKRPDEYPKGFSPAAPPGFCSATCDCMDDQRPQQAWETKKPWLEDRERAQQCEATLNALSSQTAFVRKRGEVSKRCYFETVGSALSSDELTRPAFDLASTITRTLMSILEYVPRPELSSDIPICVPGLAYSGTTLDYEPVRYDLVGLKGMEAPNWVHMDSRTGELSVDSTSKEEAQFKIEMHFPEGLIAKGVCRITSDRRSKPWVDATHPILGMFLNTQRCGVDREVRWVIEHHLSEICDLESRTPRSDVSLGRWLNTMTTVLRLARVSSCATVIGYREGPEPDVIDGGGGGRKGGGSPGGGGGGSEWRDWDNHGWSGAGGRW